MGMLGQNPWYPQCPHFSGWGVQSSLTRKIQYFLSACLWERGPLMLVCFNMHVSRESPIFGNAFSMAS